jgi:hypothetical protein
MLFWVCLALCLALAAPARPGCYCGSGCRCEDKSKCNKSAYCPLSPNKKEKCMHDDQHQSEREARGLDKGPAAQEAPQKMDALNLGSARRLLEVLGEHGPTVIPILLQLFEAFRRPTAGVPQDAFRQPASPGPSAKRQPFPPGPNPVG